MNTTAQKYLTNLVLSQAGDNEQAALTVIMNFLRDAGVVEQDERGYPRLTLLGTDVFETSMGCDPGGPAQDLLAVSVMRRAAAHLLGQANELNAYTVKVAREAVVRDRKQAMKTFRNVRKVA